MADERLLNTQNIQSDIDEKEAAEVLAIFRKLPSDKKAVVIAFMNGMEVQRSIVSLLHDICKTNFYKTEMRNQKTYDPEKVKKASSYQVKKDNGGSFITGITGQLVTGSGSTRLTASPFQIQCTFLQRM